MFPMEVFYFCRREKKDEGRRGESVLEERQPNEVFTAVDHNEGKERRPKQHYEEGDKMA